MPEKTYKKKHLTSFQLIILGFAGVILLGTVLLMLPFSTLDKVPKTSVLDLYEFKYLSRPAQISMAELKKLFEMLKI